MKTMKFIGGLAMAIFVFAITSQAQFFAGPHSGPFFSSFPVTIPTATTNFAGAPIQLPIPVGPNGVGLSLVWYAPNTTTKALVVTNCQWLFQGSANGTDWINLPVNLAATLWSVTPAADSVTTVYTNLVTIPAATHNNIGNLRYLRPTWFTNGNGTNQIVISNAFWTVR